MDNKDKSNPIHLEKIEVDGVYGSKILDDLVTKHFHELTEYKSKILEAKLAELGIDYDINLESERRFKQFQVEIDHQNGCETFYWNDGSVGGQRIVTFRYKHSANWKTPMKSEIGLQYW